jgi:hypothetical protein
MNLATSSVNWSEFKPLLTCRDLTRIYPFSLMGLRKMAQRRSPKIPTPCSSRPFLFRRDDVQRHYDRMVA